MYSREIKTISQSYAACQQLTGHFMKLYCVLVIHRPSKLFHGPICIGPACCRIEENPMLKKTLACAAILCFSMGFIRLNDAQGADLAKGKELYEARCTLCHGPQGDGKGKAAISLKLELPDFTKKTYWENPNIEQKIAATIKDGVKGKMRPSPDLSPEDVQSIVLYITQAFRPK